MMICSGLQYFAIQRNMANSGSIVWKEVDEGWIRYDSNSGSTQLITPLARFVIDLLDASKRMHSLADIVDAVLDAEPDANRNECEIEVDTVLKILSEHQLIQKDLL